MKKRHKKRITVKFDVSVVKSGDDSIEPEHVEPMQIASRCVSVIIDAIDLASEADAKGDNKPTIPISMPVDLVSAPNCVISCTWEDLLEAETTLIALML